MPSYIEYWRTLSYSTCQQYKSYKNIVRFRKNLFKHATKNGVTLINSPGDNDYQNFINNIIKPKARRAAEDNGIAFRAKRVRLPKIEIAQAPVVVDNALEQRAERPMEQEQQPEQMQEAAPEPIEENDVAPVPIDIAPPCGRNTNGAHKPLILNGIAIEVDPVTLMVNATQMCQAAGKRWIKYYDNDKTKSYIQYIETKVRIRTLDLIKSNRGGDHSGTMVHRLIAYDLASWLSQDVKLQFYMWNDELRIENAALSTQIEELRANAALVPIAISLPHCNNTPIFNGANKPLVLNGLVIEVDPDTFMVNATQMCRAAGKLFGHYWQLDSTKNYLQKLSSDIGIPISELYKKTKGGRQDLQGTCVHFRLAVHLAHWLSIEVQVQFSKWIAELLLTGRVELGKEMNVQQLEDVWKRRIEKGEAKAAVDLDAERNRCQEIILQKNEFEQRMVAMEEDQQRTDEEKKALMAIKAREELETTIQALVKNIAPMIASYKDGDNALYLARIDGTKFKYGHTKNLVQRFDAHTRPGVYSTFEPVGVFSCNNGVAAEDKVHAYVKKKKIGVDYGTQREIILLDNVDKMQRLIKMMQKCTTFLVSTQPANDNNTDVLLRRIDAETSIELKRIELLMECKITFEQYLQMK